ncbi:hypothetical protein VSS74_29410 [Conexibacter stalactiti]|uniref:DUF3108 domain-containing protein n=1 Tax=Conexibacter stalactiti TaxID=1940611 RepID=A0ABU4HZ63_9ACTN|nr:hypothetical protein [Conexibacter stalactiti]MDW5598515.1 hypothetical protein [Conexibacter stalactiti]MEC5039157.1 hypothetical protein [Conexibacter stalactiti]
MPARLRTALVLASASAALPPAAAHAMTYRLAYEGDVSYRHVRETEDGAFKETTTASFHVSGRADGVEILGGKLVGPVSITDVRATQGRASRVSTTDQGTDKTCRGEQVLRPTPGMLFPAAPVYGWPAGMAAILPFLSAELPMTCTDSDGGVGDESVIVSNVTRQGTRAAPSRFHVGIDMPTGALSLSGYEWDLKRSESALRTCPGRDYYTRVCTTTLDGTVRFLPLRSDDRDTPRSGGSGGGGGGGVDDIAPKVEGAATLSAGAKTARVKVRCITGCRARMSVFLPPRGGRKPRGKSSAAAAPLASRTVTLAPGRPTATAVTVALGAAARRAVAAAGSARVEVVLDPPVGATVRRSLSARLP